ncbi:nitroreductase family deazaflavin-dependent oxidoreductase [Actinoplanes palleronii]|uniref:Deazaflavin-dependent oxidoreductase (Nitroreductase family) n=1 Tax=Actinoplanes palleronii TaxID=113570 RepID=A0ABQ4BED0_9ACTN|nr:nitroreductase family deazaflavin-dependent oxidoreductase [Actinoplanes palleronii]GIE68696.1 hypothetical protein Apa02nite_048040 [Actinoplanes palleronii]
MTAGSTIKRGWFRLLTTTVNPVAVAVVRRGWGPLSLVQHVGRRTGTRYETPMLLVRVGPDFLAELTYGPDVAWLRNTLAAGGCTVLHRGVTYQIDRVDPVPPSAGLAAFGHPAALVLRLARRRDFRRLHVRTQKV